jgi:hypothetical protein
MGKFVLNFSGFLRYGRYAGGDNGCVIVDPEQIIGRNLQRTAYKKEIL